MKAPGLHPGRRQHPQPFGQVNFLPRPGKDLANPGGGQDQELQCEG